MKDLDFRVWDNFHPWTSSQFWYSKDMSLREFFEWVEQHTNTTNNIQQYIGKTDINNKKIYEGDICTFRPKSNKGPKYVISYDNDSCSYVFKNKNGCILEFDDGDMYGPVHFNDQTIRVVGNVFETPELLN